MRKNILIFNALIVVFTVGTVSCTTDRLSQTAEAVRLSSALTQNDYLIGKGDILQIVTWKEPDFSGDFPVRIDGKISFPLLDDMHAAGRTTARIRDELTEKLKEYVMHPVVSVSVKSMESQKFYILGEVAKQGEYPLSKNLTVLHAIALAQGFTEWAGKNDIVLIRQENGSETLMKISYGKIVKQGELHQNVLIRADDIIVVP
ncbi:MAG: polysaccharide biosynthesis/export family protein [Desulfobacterales bacterium]